MSSLRCFQGYDDFDFNVVTHAVNDFCVVCLNFYLDIIKDRLYCEEKDGLAWRSPRRRCISFWTP